MGDMEDIRRPLVGRADMVDRQRLILLILEPVEPQIIIEIQEVHHPIGNIQQIIKRAKSVNYIIINNTWN